MIWPERVVEVRQVNGDWTTCFLLEHPNPRRTGTVAMYHKTEFVGGVRMGRA